MRALRKEGGGIMGFFRRTWAILSAIPRIVPFILRNLPGKTHPGVRDFVSALGAASPSVPLFAAGYCWGGKHAFLLAAAPPHAALKAVFTGHPSMLALPADAAAVRLPLSVAVGSRDDAVGPKEVATIKAALDTVAAEREGAAGEVVVYDGASHGFCVRLDRSDETERRHAGEAEDQAVRWFERFLE
jgi:dienelactone hydrolase